MKRFEITCSQIKSAKHLRILVDSENEHCALKALENPNWKILLLREVKDAHIGIKARFLSWEKLRIAYNCIMLIAGIPIVAHIYWLYNYSPEVFCRMSLPLMIFDYSNIWVLLLFALVFGIIANCMYSLGPVVECYWVIVFNRSFHRRARYCLFASILFLSLLAQHIIHLPFVRLHFSMGSLSIYSLTQSNNE